MVENWQNLNLRTGSPKKFMDLRFADKSKEICGFNLLTSMPQKFANLRLRIEPKNLRICDLRTLKRYLRASLWNTWRGTHGDH